MIWRSAVARWLPRLIPIRADVGVRDGKIVAVADRIEGAARTIDASGLLVMPGGIDSHVHLSQAAFGGPKMADDFESGTRSAIAGGNTTVLPFALQPRGASSAHHRRRLSQGGRRQVLLATTGSI